MDIPAAPRTAFDSDLRRGFRLSIAAHVGLALLLLLKTVVFPGKPIAMLPTLRVDVVGLPDIVKQDLNKLTQPQAKPQEQAKPKPAPVEPVKTKPAPPVEVAKPDELVLKPKHVDKKVDKKETEKTRVKRLKSALKRIEALEKISDDAKPKKAAAVLIKGNKISKGSSVSGDAKESDVASYYDSVRDRLQQNWEIPVWFKNQDISAKVQIYIDRNGRLRNFRFIRPSGNPQFDDAVKKTISESQPFPPPPEDVLSSVLIDGILVGFPL